MVKFNTKVLDKGLTVLHEKRDVPVTTVMLATKYGGIYETEEEKGIAHFIEHMCFKGTEKRTTKQIADEIESVGGVLNAFTSENVTAYHAKIPSNQLKKVSEVLFDVFYNPIFPEPEMKREAEVICEEIKMYEDNPMGHVVHKLGSVLYEKPFGIGIIGTPENVRGMTRQQLLEKHRAVYTPKNSVLIVVGKNDFQEVLEIAEEFNIDREYQKQEKPEIVKRIKSEEEKRANLNQTNLGIGFHFPTGKEKEKYAAELFSDILGGGMSSRLFTEVREKRGLVYGVKTDIDRGPDYSYLMIWAGTDPTKAHEVKTVSIEEFHKMKDLTQEELEAGKIKLLGSHNVGSEGSDDVAREILSSWSEGDAKEFYEYEEKIKAVTLEDIKSLADKTDYSFFSVGP